MAAEKAFTVTEPTELLPLLILKLEGKGRNKVKGLLTHRQVTVDGKIMTRHDYLVQPGQIVSLRNVRGPAKETMRGVRLLFEDDALIVIDKPPGLLSMATEQERERTAYRVLMDYVQFSNPDNRVFIVHRLDRETSGVIVFAKRESIQQALQNAWKEVVQERSYVAVVEGKVLTPEGKITSWLQESKALTMFVGKPGVGLKAVLNYKVLQVGKVYSMLEIHLETGRKNQIRVQMQEFGHPVLGDKRYGSRRQFIDRLCLHAHVLAFRHPVTGELLRFETPIPPLFRKMFSDTHAKK